MLALNIKQEPKKVIFDRFNALNALQLNPDDFLLSSVEAFNDAQRKTNTRVLASPVALCLILLVYHNLYLQIFAEL
jgi:hypothetical protein